MASDTNDTNDNTTTDTEVDVPQRPVNTIRSSLERQQRTRDKMTDTEHVDGWGRKFRVMVRKGGDPSKGMILGPAPLDSLGLRRDVMVILHNGLYDRGIITMEDARRRPMDVLAALNAAQRVNVQRIQNLYAGIEAPTTDDDDKKDTPTPTPSSSTPPQDVGQMVKPQSLTKEDGSDAQARS